MSYQSWKLNKDQQYLLDQGVNAARPLVDAVALIEAAAKETISGNLDELIDNREFTDKELGPIVDLAYEKALEAARGRVDDVKNEMSEEEDRLECEREEEAATKRKK